MTIDEDLGRIGRYSSIALVAARTPEPHYDDPDLRSAHGDRPLRDLTPAFWGCHDWHSAVHSHWTMLRALPHRVSPALEAELREALDTALDRTKMEAETRTIAAAPAFELPYGLAWLLKFDVELSRHAEGVTWREALEPLAQLAADRLRTWLVGLDHPDEIGLHRNTAFSMGLLHDWATSSNPDMAHLVRDRALEWWARPEPGSLLSTTGPHDFLSPALTVADLMRRILDRSTFGRFIDRGLPGINLEINDFHPVPCSDPSNGRLSHLQGLNLSRAAMLASVAAALGPQDHRSPGLRKAAERHFAVGDADVTGEHFAGAHWLPTFATMALQAIRS